MHEVVFIDDHVSTVVAPLDIVVGDADNVTLGEGVAANDTVADTLRDPPGPVQVRVKTDVAVIAPLVSVPLMGLTPLQLPDAAQAVAFVEVHVNVDVAPDATLPGVAEKLTVGSGGAVTGAIVTIADDCAVALPAPVQVKVNVLVDVSNPLLAEPLVPLDPLQAPDAVHPVASLDVQVSVTALPLTTLAALVLKLTVGAG
jgi:hypothetical protein